MIWHIFKKDLKLLWPLAAIIAAMNFMNIAIWLELGNFGEPQVLTTIAAIYMVPLLLGITALIVTAVHQDTLFDDCQDWLVRPIHRRDLILAKLLFVLVAVQGPILLADLAHCMATGFNFRDSLSAALSRNVYLFLFTSLPVLALAAMTSTLIEVIGVILAFVILIFVAILIATHVAPPNAGFGGTFALMDHGELMVQFWNAVGLATAIAVIPLQYFRRATLGTRGIALGALLVAVSISVFLPWSSAFAFQKWLSPNPAAAKAVLVAFEPNFGKIRLNAGDANPANSVWLPLRVSGLEPESIVLNDRTYVRIFGRDGAILFQGPSIDNGRTTEVTGMIAGPRAIDDFSVRTTRGGYIRTHQFITLPKKIYELVRNQPVRMELDYSLTLFHIGVSDKIKAVDGDEQIASLGLCKTRIDDDGDEVEIACLRTGDNPVNCATGVLENTVSGHRNPAYNACNIFWLPYNAHFAFNSMLRFEARLRFRDPQGLAKYPVDRSQLANAQVALKAYQPVAHFTRQLIIPKIRLSDWEADVHLMATSPDLPPALPPGEINAQTP